MTTARKPRQQKYPLSWHEEGIRDAEVYLKKLEADAERARFAAFKLACEIAKSKEKLAEARRKGLTEYPA
jgi:hypothetical protein